MSWPDQGLSKALVLRGPSSGEERVIIDVGAHHGETLRTVLSSTMEPLTYLALEPNPESCRLLEAAAASLARDGLRFECLQAAAGPTTGTSTFFRTQESAVAGLLRPAEGLEALVPRGDHRVLQEIEVEVLCVDQLLTERGLTEVDVLKVDSEGYDLDVLKGAWMALDAGRIGAVLTEVFFVSYREGQAFFWEIATYLSELGYFFVNLFDTRETGQGRLYTGNALWVSESVARANNYL